MKHLLVEKDLEIASFVILKKEVLHKMKLRGWFKLIKEVLNK